jgi:hypothetical protein
MTDDLFATDDPQYPRWLPDETLYSLISRHHALSGNRLWRETSQQLFGHPQGGYQHDFPNRIGELVRRVGDHLGEALWIVRHHTIAPFFYPFAGPEVPLEINAAMIGASTRTIKYRLGLLTSRVRAYHPLKACRKCMDEDRAVFGVAYWHRRHQLPGVILCENHRTWLHRATVKSTAVSRFGWFLPAGHELEPIVPNSLVADRAADMELFGELAGAARCLTEMAVDFRFNKAALGLCFRNEMIRQSLATHSGRLKLSALADRFSHKIYRYRTLEEFASTDLSIGATISRLRDVSAACNQRLHPLHYLVLALVVFGRWSDFLVAYNKTLTALPDENSKFESQLTLDFLHDPQRARQREVVVAAITGEGLTVRAAAGLAGVDWTTAKVWATQAGLSSSRRPKVLTIDKAALLLAALRAGEEKAIVAERLGISIQTVTTTLRTHVGLSQEWSAARFEHARMSARDAWIQAMDADPAAGIKALRVVAAGAYAWLYRHDMDWLAQHAPQSRSKDGGNHPAVRWDERDSGLAAELRTAAASSAIDSGNAVCRGAVASSQTVATIQTTTHAGGN